MGAAFTLASFVISNLPGWIDSGMKVYDLYVHTKAVIDENTGPGKDDWNDLDDRATELEDRINDISKDA